MENNKYTFWSFLKGNSIEIPVIQRDYAWGRVDMESIRKKVLNEIKKALERSEEKLLDYVYGSIENGRLQPLDGQQRLTTLWLLHWYIALRANKLNEICPESSEICGILRKFTYETRISSREFCGELCDPKNFKSFDGTKIAEFIKNQTWFHSSWEQDPTVSAMLTMLSGTGNEDGVEDVFRGDFEDYWDRLTNWDCKIKFFHQSLEGFQLSDDLYVKMNARGKPLTSFECFKADLVGYINKKAEVEEEGEWGKLSDLKDGIPIKMDTIWTDIFWENKSKDCSIDEIYFTFLNRFFMNNVFMNYRIRDLSSGDEYYKYFEKDTAIEYSSLDNYKWKIGDGEDKGIKIDLFKDLRDVLNNYYDFFQKQEGEEKLKSFFKCPWGIPFEFIPTYKEDSSIAPFNMIQRVVFYAVCKYFKEGEADEKSLKRWMRFVWNLVSVRDLVDGKDRMEMKTTDYINDFEKVKEAIVIIGHIEDSHNTYKSLCDAKIKMSDTVLYDRFEEEVEKARQIEEGRIEEEVLREVEKYSFFRGGIGFLFRSENGGWNWESFPQKWGNVKKYFMEVVANGESSNDNSICVKENNAYLLRTLISFFSSEKNGPAERCNPVISLRGDTCKRDGEWDKRGKPIYNNMASTWRYLLNNKAIYGAVHRLLMGDSIEKIEEGPNQRVLWMLSQTRLLDYVIKIDSKPLRYRVSGDFEAFFNSNTSVRIFMGPIDEKNKPFEQSLKYIANIEESKIKEIYDRGHFICQVDYNKGKKGWGDAFILVPEDEGNEIKSLQTYEEWRKEHNEMIE